MKIKLKGLMKDDAAINNSIVMHMSDVEIDGVPFEINIGEDANAGESEEI